MALPAHAWAPARWPLCTCGAAAPRSSAVRRRGPRCRAAGEGSSSSLPVVDAVVLPPPATGSQYSGRWRSSWMGGNGPLGGNGGHGGGGRGGGAGGRQARTSEWSRGPGSGLLFVLMHRMRLLLAYMLYITVLWGALHAGFSLVRKLSAGVASFTSAAAGLAGGLVGGGSSGSSSDGAAPAAAAAAAAPSAGAACDEPAAAPAGDQPLAAAAAAADAAAPPSASAGSADGGGGSDSTAAAAAAAAAARARVQRPTAAAFEGLMSVVIPLYCCLLGSVVFFAVAS